MKTLCAICLIAALSGCATVSAAAKNPPVEAAAASTHDANTPVLRPTIYQYILLEELAKVYRKDEESLLGYRLGNTHGFISPPVITSAHLNPRYQTK